MTPIGKGGRTRIASCNKYRHRRRTSVTVYAGCGGVVPPGDEQNNKAYRNNQKKREKKKKKKKNFAGG